MKIYNSLLFIFFLSLTCFSVFTHSKLIPEDIKIMSIKETTEEICSKSSNELLEFYQNPDSQYTYDPEDINKEVKEIIKKALAQESPAEQLRDYIIGNVIILIFIIILFVIFIIVWIPFCIIICCRKCTFGIPKSCGNHLKILMTFGLIFTIIGALITCAGFSKDISLGTGIFGLGCGVLKIEQHLIYGDEYTDGDTYWYGFNPTIDKLNSITIYINDTFRKIDVAGFDTDLKTILKNLEQINKDIKDEKIYIKKYSNPIPNQEEKMPEFIERYNNSLEKTSNAIKENIDINSVKILNDTFFFLKGLDVETILAPFGIFLKKLEDYSNQIDGSFNNLVDKYKGILDRIDNYSRIASIIFFSFNLAILVGIIVSIILSYNGKSRIFLCTFWSLMYILLLLGLVLSGVILVLGHIFTDVAGGLKTLITEIKTIDIKNNDDMVGTIVSLFKDIADTCLNGDGLLLKDKEFIDGSGNDVDVKSIDKCSNLIQELVEKKNSINNIHINFIDEAIQSFNNIKLNPKKHIEELKNVTDKITSYIQEYKNDGVTIYDSWGFVDGDCNGDTNCKVITNWSLQSMVNYYENQLKNGAEGIGVLTDYYNSLLKFWEDINEIPDKVLSKQKRLNSEIENLKQLQIKFIEDLVKKINQDEKIEIPNIKLNNLLNCGFIKRDINKLIEEIDSSLGLNLMITGFLLFSTSISEFIASIFIMIFLAGIYKNNMQGYEIDNIKENMLNNNLTLGPVVPVKPSTASSQKGFEGLDWIN